jgi:uncharacterized protein YacL
MEESISKNDLKALISETFKKNHKKSKKRTSRLIDFLGFCLVLGALFFSMLALIDDCAAGDIGNALFDLFLSLVFWIIFCFYFVQTAIEKSEERIIKKLKKYRWSESHDPEKD